MGKDTWGKVQAIYTSCGGIYGIRARINLPDIFAANGLDGAHYLDAYVAIFPENDMTNALAEAGPMFHGEYHQDKPKNPHDPLPPRATAIFAHRWAIGVNPSRGGFRGQPKQGEREVFYAGPKALMVELKVLAKDQAEVRINNKPFKVPNDFTFNGGTGVEASTFEKGFNVKACVGLNDEGGKGVHFADFSIEMKEVLRKTTHGMLWRHPPTLHHSLPLNRVTNTLVKGNKLIVTYPRP